MQTQIPRSLIFTQIHPQTHFPSNLTKFKFKPIPPKPLISLHFLHQRSILFTASAASENDQYNGWDSLALHEGSSEGGKYTQLRDLLVKVGLDDKKYVYVFVLGFVSALVVSRVRVKSVLVVPVCICVFAAGFCVGLYKRGGNAGKGSNVVGKDVVSRNGGVHEKRGKGNVLRVFVESMRKLIEEVEPKVKLLGNEVQLVVESDKVGVSDLRGLSDIVKSMMLDIGEAKDVVNRVIVEMGGLDKRSGNGGTVLGKDVIRRKGAVCENMDIDDVFRVFVGRMRKLVQEVELKVIFLETEVNLVVKLDKVGVRDLRGLSEIVKSVMLEIGDAKDVVESVIGELGGLDNVGDIVEEQQDIDRSSSLKSNGRKREQSGMKFSFKEIFGEFGGLISDSLIGVGRSKVKDSEKRKSTEMSNSKVVGNQVIDDVNGLDGKYEEKKVEILVAKGNVGNAVASNPGLNQNGMFTKGQKKFMVDLSNINESTNREDLCLQSGDGKITDYKNEAPVQDESLRDPLDLGIDMKTRKMERDIYAKEIKASLSEEQLPDTFNGDYRPPYNKEKRVNGSCSFEFSKESRKLEDEPSIEDHPPSSSTVISEDVVFDKHLTQATDLLKQARECLKGKVDEERAEVILYKSARLLSRAIAMKPMSLLAVGQLGNTYLLHGELKLIVSRELRNLFSSTAPVSCHIGRRVQVKGFDDGIVSKDRIASVLVDTCEECEELLVEAGRKYKTALTIDGNDVRALYNWGLALSFRAQLIADIGPGAALDADKVYLAAIDKFDAMMSKSSVYAPEALFRWGMTLQQRSQLRPSNSKEKIKLLLQSKRLFEDALSMDSNNLQVREALSSCLSELDYWQF